MKLVLLGKPVYKTKLLMKGLDRRKAVVIIRKDTTIFDHEFNMFHRHKRHLYNFHVQVVKPVMLERRADILQLVCGNI